MNTSSRWIVTLLGALAATGIALAQRGAGQVPRGGSQAPQGCTASDTCNSQRATAGKLPATLVAQLQGTLADEFLARDFYRAAAERFGGRRFANHQRAEQNHIAALTDVLRAAGAEPVTAAGHIEALPATVAATQQRIAELERDMIQAYDRLLEMAANTSLVPLLENIQAANRRHLDSARSVSRGPGRTGVRRSGPAVDCVPSCASARRSCRR